MVVQVAWREVRLIICGEESMIASMNKIENWIHEAERRIWFLFECRLRGVSYMNACERGQSLTRARL
jgi:hypothetical protein